MCLKSRYLFLQWDPYSQQLGSFAIYRDTHTSRNFTSIPPRHDTRSNTQTRAPQWRQHGMTHTHTLTADQMFSFVLSFCSFQCDDGCSHPHVTIVERAAICCSFLQPRLFSFCFFFLIANKQIINTRMHIYMYYILKPTPFLASMD